MKYLHLITASLLLSVASCSTDVTDEPIEVRSTSTTSLVTPFTNGTYMTVGKAANILRSARATALALNKNAAGDLQMPAQPAIPAEALTVDRFQSWQLGVIKDSGSPENNWQGEIRPVIIPTGKIHNLNSANLKADIYVENGATLIADNYGGNYPQATKIVVLPGGKLQWNSGLTMDRIEVYNYGTFEIYNGDNFSVNQQGAKFFTVGDVKAPGKFSYGGRVYIGGNVLTGVLNPYQGSQLKVEGDVNITGTTSQMGTNNTEVWVEGSLIGNRLETNSGSEVYVGCKLWAKTHLYITNGSQLQAGHIISPTETKIDGGQVYLRDGSLASLGNFNIADVSDAYIQVLGGGNALLEAKTLHIQESVNNGLYDLNQVLDPVLYVNYANFTIPNYNPAKMNHDYGNNIRTSLNSAGINVAKAKATEGLGCGERGFNVPPVNETPNPVPPVDETPSPVPPVNETPSPVPPVNETPNPVPPVNETPNPVPPVDETPNPVPPTGGDFVEIKVPNMENEWKIIADDFAIRVNGTFVEGLVPKENTVKYQDVVITESGLTVKVDGLQKLPAKDEYTYNVYLWIKRETWEAMTAEQKQVFIAGTDQNAVPTGFDPERYEVRSNTYFGLSGQQDTPYVKVSLHIVKK